jgi:putative DNA primase/helicase
MFDNSETHACVNTTPPQKLGGMSVVLIDRARNNGKNESTQPHGAWIDTAKIILTPRAHMVLSALGIETPDKGHTTCPFPDSDHKNGDATPSFRWSDEDEQYYCTCTNHRGKSHGDIVELIHRMKGRNWAETRKWINDFIGDKDFAGKEKISTDNQSKKSGTTELAKRLWRKAVPIKGTLAERYLTETRHIQMSEWPENLRFDPNHRERDSKNCHPALLIGMSAEPGGEIVAFNRIYLQDFTDDDGAIVVDKALISDKKSVIGKIGGLAAWFGAPGPHLVATEGGEDAMSCLISGATFVCSGSTGGNVANIKIPACVERITIFADSKEGGGIDDTGAVMVPKARKNWAEAGVTASVFVALAAHCKDANALLQANGVEAVKAALDGAAPVEAKPRGSPRKAAPVGGSERLEELGDPDAGGVLTQDSVALAFTERFKGRLRYCHTSGEWFCWAGTHWARDEKRTAFNWARNITREMTAGKNPGDVKDFRKAGFCSGVERFAQSDPELAVTAKEWNSDPFIIGTPGGTVDLKTGILRAGNPREGVTRVTSVPPAIEANCPNWLAFLNQVTGGDAGMIRFLQQWAGYSLTGDTREQSLVFMHGDGGNGKGVFLRAITGILHDYAVTAAMETFTASKGDKHPTDLAMLAGARMVSASETNEGQSWAEARINSITGNDPITARFMHKDFFTYIPQFKLFIIGNHKPILKNVNDAAKRRFNLVPFVYKPAKKDPLLDSKLKAEWPEIFRWMIDGCLDWLENGLIRPDSVVKETAAYFAEQDIFGQWLGDCCEINLSPDIKATNIELFSSWKAYATRAGEDAGSQKTFSSKMLRIGFTPYRTKSARGFLGVYLKAETVD